MEERIIDDEYGKGVRLKKTKDGYVLADELNEGEELLDNTDGAEETEEVSFAFPSLEEDEVDEDLIGLDPEEVEKILAERARIEAENRAIYEKLCKAGYGYLETGDFAKAEIEFSKALPLCEEHKDASVGLWRAKTEEFAKPQVLIEEYEDAGVESLEYDLGVEAVETIKKEYRSAFEKEYNALIEEETPLKAEFEGKQESRRGYLKGRLTKSAILFGVSLLPLIAFVILTVVYGGKISSTPDGRYIAPTVVWAFLAVASFIAFIVLMNGFFNSLRLYTRNERADGTDVGARLVQIALYKEMYEFFLEEGQIEEENA